MILHRGHILLFVLILKTFLVTANDTISLSGFSYHNDDINKHIRVSEIKEKTFDMFNDSVLIGNNSFWLRFNAENHSEFEFIDVIINLRAKGFVIYRPFRNSLETFGKGYHKPLFKKKDIENGKNWDVYLEPGTSETFFIYVIEPEVQYLHSDCMQVSVDKNRFSVTNEFFFVGFEQAVFFIIILISLFALFIYREKIYLYFVFYLIFHDFLFLSGYDFFGNYLFRGNINFNFQARTLYPAGIYFYMLFLFNALDFNQVFNKLYNTYIKAFMLVFSISMLFFTVMSIVDFSFYSNNIVNVSFFFAVCGFFIILAGIRNYQSYRRIFALGALIFMVSACVRVYQVDFVHSTYHLPYEIGVILDSFIFIYALNLRTKHLLNEKEQSELENKKLEEQLKNSKKELISNSFNLIKRNAIYKDLSSKVADLSAENNLDATKLKNLINSFDDKKQDEKYWKEFDVLFNAVHDGFSKRLYSQYPGLTNSELRLCCLLRLAMTSKEIANLTSRTEKSVEVMRSRIRKKLNMPPNQSFSVFLLNY